jgi:hypothetical protein
MLTIIDKECEVHFDGKSYTFRATRLYSAS